MLSIALNDRACLLTSQSLRSADECRLVGSDMLVPCLSHVHLHRILSAKCEQFLICLFKSQNKLGSSSINLLDEKINKLLYSY